MHKGMKEKRSMKATRGGKHVVDATKKLIIQRESLYDLTTPALHAARGGEARGGCSADSKFGDI